jgi:hypothetical protein
MVCTPCTCLRIVWRRRTAEVSVQRTVATCADKTNSNPLYCRHRHVASRRCKDPQQLEAQRHATLISTAIISLSFHTPSLLSFTKSTGVFETRTRSRIQVTHSVGRTGVLLLIAELLRARIGGTFGSMRVQQHAGPTAYG